MDLQPAQTMMIGTKSIDFGNLDTFLKTIQFDPKSSQLFPKGFLAFEPVRNNTGGVLYPENTELTKQHILKLRDLKKSTPDHLFPLSIKKDSGAADHFRELIKEDFKKVIDENKSKPEFVIPFTKIEKAIDTNMKDILADDDLVYTVIRSKAVESASTKSGFPYYYYHSIIVSIYAIIIVQNAFVATGERFIKSDLVNVAQFGLLHDIGPIEKLVELGEFKDDELKKRFIQEIISSSDMVGDIKLDNDCVEGLIKLGGYYLGEKEVILDDRSLSSKYAAIIVTADILNFMIKGAFSEAVSLDDATDSLYVLAGSGELKKGYVAALAKGLKQNELYDFYQVLDKLRKMCLLEKYAVPYPNQGFKSASIVICGGQRKDCNEYDSGSPAVNLIKETQGLEPGAYGRCRKLSEELVKYYKTHYKDIKQSVIEQSKEIGGKK